MSRKYQLKFRNLDLTRDINERFVGLIQPGLISGGTITPIASQLKVTIAPWKVFNRQGMVAEETSDFLTVDLQVGQTNVVALKVVYNQSAAPEVAFEVVEKGVFDGMPNKDDYIVFGHVVVPLTATEILDSYIDLKPRMVIDPLGRRQERGTVSSTSQLPQENNLIGDTYKVTDGVGGTVNLFGWNGFTWVNMTNVIELQTQLTRHRQNLFANEKHLTDAEKLAVEGTFGLPSSTNKFVTSTDPRVPTQGENDALVGSHGTPSGSNRYVTENLQYAQPSVVNVPAGTTVFEIGGTPMYLGRGGIGSHYQYFKLYHATAEREYLNSDRSIVDVIRVYKDAALTQEITNPGAEALVELDQYGFWIAGSIWVVFNQATDLDARLLYGKRTTLANTVQNTASLFDITPKSAQINRELLTKIEAISGLEYDDTLPEKATNIELYQETTDIKKYANASSTTDMVVSDFDKMNSIPEYTGLYEKNVGLINYVFENSSGIPFTYDNTGGIVSYTGAVPDFLPLVRTDGHHVFVDGDENEYKIVGKTTNTLTIAKRNGDVPNNINTTISKNLHGSIKIDDNPRKINLSTMQLAQHRERIVAGKMIAVKNEFHPVTGQLAFEIQEPLKSVIHKEHRLRAYGNIQTRTVFNPLVGPSGGPRTQVFSVNKAIYSITGHFTDLELIADCNADSPIIEIWVDGVQTGTFDLSYRVGLTSINSFDTLEDVKMPNHQIVSGLEDGVTHTVEIVVPDAVPEFVFYGFDLIRRNFDQANLLPGRAFVQGDAVYQDEVENIPLAGVGTLRRGGVSTILYNRDLEIQNHSYQMTDFDGSSEAPIGGVTNGSKDIVVGTGLTKLASFFRKGDIVKVVTLSAEETKRIEGISGSTVTFDSAFTMTGSGVLIHLCSTENESYDKEVEARRIIAEFSGLATFSEFQQLPPIEVDRVSVLEDGSTKFVGKELSFTELGVEGYERAITFPKTTSRLRICAVCSSMEIIVANDANVPFTYTVNGSSPISGETGAAGYTKVSLFANGRFQGYEVDIYDAQNLNIVGFIFKEPDVPNKPVGLEIGQIKYLASYRMSNTSAPNTLLGSNLPLGSVGFDAYTSFVRFINGAGAPWSSTIDWTKLYGRHNRTNAEGAFFEWTFYGRTLAFEYTSTDDGGHGLVQVRVGDNVAYTIVKEENFPTAVFKGGIVRNDNIGGGGAGGIVDFYGAVPARRRIEVEFEDYNKYTVRVQIPSPMSKNSDSSDYYINVNQIFFTNSHGYFGYANELARSNGYYLGYSNHYDRRNFGNGTRSLDDLISTVGDVFDLVDEGQRDSNIVDGGTFV